MMKPSVIFLLVICTILSCSAAQAHAPDTTPSIATTEPITGLTATNTSPTQFGQTTTLTALVQTGTDITYTWDLGDGARTQGAVVGHVYPHDGIYTALVTAVNPLGWQVVTTFVVVKLPDTFNHYLNMLTYPSQTGVPLPAP